MCPVGYYYEWVGPQEQGPLKPLAGKSICRKCHPRCKQCTAYGFHEQVRSLSSNDHQQSFKNSYETPRIRKKKINPLKSLKVFQKRGISKFDPNLMMYRTQMNLDISKTSKMLLRSFKIPPKSHKILENSPKPSEKLMYPNESLIGDP